jgi:hypothetical protein
MRVCENGVAKVKTSGIIAFAAQPDPAGETDNEIRRDGTCSRRGQEAGGYASFD